MCPIDCCTISFRKERDLLELNGSGTRIHGRYRLTTSTLTLTFREELAGDEPSWLSLMAKGAVSYEESCLTRAENERRQRKMFSVSCSSTQHCVCADSGGTFHTAVELFSHKKTH